MADNQFSSTVEALFKGMDNFVTTKTVVGEAVRIDDTIILPLIDVTCGMAAGAFNQSVKNNGAGGMSAKISPSAILVIQNGVTKLVNIKHQDAVTKIIDMVPDFVNRFTNGKTSGDISEDAMKKAKDMAVEMESVETEDVTEK
ncbi:MAG: GerW family sporulation protein [Clostridium sp.]